MPNTLWTVACGGTLHGRLRRRHLRGIPPSRCRRCHCRTGLSLQTEKKEDPPGARIKSTDIETFTVIFVASTHIDIIDNNIVIKKRKTTVAWICFFKNKEAITTITTIIIIIKRRRKRKWTTVTAPSSSSSSSPLIIVYRTGEKSIIIIIIIIAATEIASRAGTSAVTSYSSPRKRKEKKETTREEEVEEDSAFPLLVSSFSSSLSSTLSVSSSLVIFATIGLFRGVRVFSEDSPKPSSSSSLLSLVLLSSSFTSSPVGWNPRHLYSTAGDDNNNNKIFTYCLVVKFKHRLLLLSSPSSLLPPSPRYGPYYIVIVVYFIVVRALKQNLRVRIQTNNNINKNHNVTVILYHNWFLSIGMPRPLDDEFSYEPPGKKNRSSDSTDSTGSSTTSSRKEAPVPKMPKSPRGNQKAASTDVSTIVPKSDIRRAQFKGSKSMPAVDASSPEPILSSTKEAEETIEMSSTGRPAETTNLHLKYLLQVTDSELQNMSREIPSSQTMSMGVPSGGKPMTNTQLVFAPVTTRDIIKIPVSEKGVEKYHVKSDSLEQQGLQLVYTKPAIDNQEARPMNYVAFKPHSQHQSTEKSLQQQQSMTGDTTIGRKRKHPQKQGRHICQYCGRGWAKPSVLEKHIRSHTNERPFPCAKCGLSFKTKSNLSKHTKSRIHALKAGLNQSASSTSSETAGTEGDVDAKDTNESEETQTETSDTDGENEDDSQKLRKDILSVPESRTRLMRGNSEPDNPLGLEEFKDKKYLLSKESLLLGDCNLSVTTKASAGGSGFGSVSADSITKESSDSVKCRMFGDMSKSQHIEVSRLQHSSTAYTPVYLTEKKLYVTKPHESKSASFEGKLDDHSLSICEATTAKSCLIKENSKITKIETSDVKLGTAWSKDNVPLSVSGLSLPNKLQSSSMNPSQEQQSVKEGEETKPVSSLILSGVPTPSTKEMVEKRISQLISDNDSIVNMPMKEPPRQKRIFRQSSDPPTSHTPKLDDLPQSSSMSKVSIPSIASIPLTPIPGETDLRKDTSNSPKPFLVSDKYNSPNVMNLTSRSQISSLAASPTKIDQLGEKISSSGGHSNEIKIEIKFSKVATMSNLVATTANQTMVAQPNIQYMHAAPTMASVSKNPENSVIKGLLMQGKTLPASFNSPSNMKAIKEKSSSVDDISKIKSETSMVSPLLQGEVGTASTVEFSVGKSSQLYEMHLCRSGPAATNTDPQIIFEPEFQYEQTDRPKLDKCSSTERDSLSGSFSQSLSSDHESSNDLDIERGERFKDEKMDATASLHENCDLTLPKKKGRPRGSKNKPKLSPNSSLQLQYQPSVSINTSTQQTPLLLATLKKKPSQIPHSTLATTTTTVSSSIIGQPMVSVQNSWTQASSMIANPVSSPSTPTKLRLKGKILLKHYSTGRIQVQSQERESETVSIISSTGNTSSAKDSSANLALLLTSSLDDGKQPTDRNSPLKKRKVRTSEPSDIVIRPGVTRAGSEPLMSRIGQSWSSNSSMKLCAEKRLSSLPETLDYKPVKTLPSTLASVISAPVTVPVVIAEPIGVPMRFFDSIQSSAVRRDLVPLLADHLTLPAIPSSSILRQDKEGPQLPAISGLVSFLLRKEFKLDFQESQEEVESSRDVEESLPTNTERLSSTKMFLSQDDVGISSQSSSLVQESPSSQNVNFGTLPKTTTKVDLIHQHLYGHSVNSLRGLTHTTLCCVQQVQPMYVAQRDNHNISMYSNWRISQPSQDPGSLTAQMLISLYNSKEFSDPIFVVSSAKSCEVNVVDSRKWSLYSKPKAWHSSSYSIEKLPNGIFNIFSTKSESSKLMLEMKLPSEDKDISHASGGSMESTPSSLGVKDVQSIKQPKRVRIFQGGFRSNEDYIYIRGRGRGKYVCEECGIRCKKPSMLKKHIRTHTDLRPYHCRHCRLSFKTKGNLTKHMKSKAHQKKCLELGIVPVPVTVDESQIDSVALAAQSAIAKDTKILDDDNEEDEEDEKDMDDGEETDDADGQFSDSEESARTSFERMDIAETIDMSVDKESECGTPAQTSSIDVAETCRMPEVHSCELSEPEGLTTAEMTKTITSNPTTSTSHVPVSLKTLTTINAPHRQGATSQLQFVKEIAHSLLDLAQRQIPLAEELPPDHLDATDSVILITTSTATNTTITTASTTTTITSTTTATAVSIQSKAEATEKTLKRQYSFDMDDSPDRGLSKSPTPQMEVPDIHMKLVSGGFHKAQCSILKQISSEEIATINQQAATDIVENSSHKEMRVGEIEKMGSQLLTHPSMVGLKIDSQEGYPKQSLITTTATAVPSDQPLAHKVYLIPDIPGNLQSVVEKEGNPGATSPSTLSLSLTGLLPNVSQRVKKESGSTSFISHPQNRTPFQFEHSFQAFQRSSNNRNDEETKDESQTVTTPLTTSSTEKSTFVCSPKTVSLSQSQSRESSCMEMIVSNSEATSTCQQSQILLPNQQSPNNPSVVSIIVSNQPCRNFENIAQQPHLGHQQQSQFVSNSSNMPQVVTPTQPFNTNIVVEPQLVENLIPEQSQTRQPVSLMEKSTTESKLLVTRQSPTAIVEKTFHSEQHPASFERQSPKLYLDNSQTRSAYGNGQTRVHVERRIPMLEVQPMIPNVQLPPQEVGKLSPIQRLGSLSPTRQYVGRLSPKRQHVDRLSPTRQHVDRLSPTRQHVDRLSPTRQHVDRLSPTRQHVDRLSPTRQHVDRLSPTRQHMDRLSPTRQHVDMLSPSQHRVDALSPTRQSISALSPRPHVDTLSSSNQSMDVLSPLRQSLIDKQMVRLSPSKKLSGERLSPTQQHIDNLSSVRQLSPTSQPMDRRTTFQVYTEKLSPTRPFSSQSPTQGTDKLSPTRLTEKPPFRRQTNRLSPSRHAEGLSSMHQLDRLSPTRQTERISPSRYENLSPTKVQTRLSPCRPDQPWPSDSQLPLRIGETQPPIQLSESQPLCMTAESKPTVLHKVNEKQQLKGLPESQVSSLVSTSQRKTLTMQASVEEPSPLKDRNSSQSLTLQKSFKDDLNKCHSCNKCFSNAQEYMEHRRQHMKTQTHHSQDSSCGHSRPHLHKCFHSEGHADSRSMSTEEIPRPPDCKNCKMDFWKQNHLPKHLWVKKHLLAMRNKNSSSTDSESAAPSEVIPDTVVTSTSVSGPSRVKTIQGTEKALDLSIDESAIVTSLSSTCVTATCTTVTSVTTTAAVTVSTTTVMPEDMVSHKPALMIADTRCASREQAAIINADITDPSSFFIHQRPMSKKYVDSSNEEVKSELIEAEILRSDIRNPATYYFVTGDESEISGASVIPITPVASHATHACHLCPRTFTSVYQLKNHLSHVDSRPYICEYCDAGFSKKQTLHFHLQIHSQQERPYVCGTCGDTFVTSENLKQHSLIHSDVSAETHRSFDDSPLHSYQQGTRISSQLPKVYDRGVHMTTSQLCSQDPFSTSFPSMISTPVQVPALNIQQKQLQYRLPSSQPQQYMEISPYSTGDTGPTMVTSTLTALALDSVVSKP